MSAIAALVQSGAAAPNLPFFLLAGVAGFAALLLTLWFGRRVESGGAKLLLFLAGLVLATTVVLVILVFGGGMSLDAIRKVG